jgi:hypothetical protein
VWQIKETQTQKMSTPRFSSEVIELFHSIYNNDQDNLKLVPKPLWDKGLNCTEVLLLTIQELNMDLGKAKMLLDMPG